MSGRVRPAAYYHDRGFCAVVCDDDFGAVLLELEYETEVSEETGDHAAYFPAFPGQVGLGDTEAEALESAQEVVKRYLVAFGERNGMEALQRRLGDFGFKLITQPEYSTRRESAGYSMYLRIPGAVGGDDHPSEA